MNSLMNKLNEFLHTDVLHPYKLASELYLTNIRGHKVWHTRGLLQDTILSFVYGSTSNESETTTEDNPQKQETPTHKDNIDSCESESSNEIEFELADEDISWIFILYIMDETKTQRNANPLLALMK
ncbi:hypothetical protein RF11_06709 [Thelohanellus kitauei]|uniref:Uncharacterized protein n=1 Tax=Thelohanellus kitauei TaxID=669202 RepID=A0A0C2IQW2_THEKT|nr:hypothetical protein RF11_06709 [Thelohanellus kitauei]